MEVKKSEGENRKFATGAERGRDVGRGKPSLLPFGAILRVLPLFDNFGRYPFNALVELSKVYEAGAAKYAPRNWEKGIPVSSFIDSAFRHLTKFKNGDTDEPHLAQYCWNVFGALQMHRWATIGDVDEAMNDLPERRAGQLPKGKFLPEYWIGADLRSSFTSLGAAMCDPCHFTAYTIFAAGYSLTALEAYVNIRDGRDLLTCVNDLGVPIPA